MFNSLKKWVQDKAVDFTPPSLSTQPSPSSPSFYSSSSPSSTRFNPTANHYYYPSTPSFEQPQYHERLSSNPSVSSRSLSRPISMDSVQSSKTINISSIPPPPASPGELDLSHLNREEQEHIANVLRRARAVDEPQTPTSPFVISSKQSPPASLSPSTSSASTASSSSTSTNSFNTEKPEIYDQNDKNDNNDDNEIRENEELPTLTLPESTLTSVHRCQVCNKEQQQQEKENSTICLQCQDDEEIARIMQNNTIPFISLDKSSSSPLTMGSNNYKEDKIYDNVTKIDQELIKTTSPFQGSSSSPINPFSIEKINDNHQGQEEKQLRRSPPMSSVSSLIKTRSNNLTEIDEDDFFYQGPSPYVSAIDETLPIEKFEESIIPSYKIDEYIDEDENDERDHVKELEETIANISRYFPTSSQQEQDLDFKSTDTNFNQPSDLSVGKIDIDSILEMEIESPSTDEHFHQLSTSASASPITSLHPVHIPISIPISTSNRRGSLSRSSGVRENLTDLLVTINESQKQTQPLQRTSSIQRRRNLLLHRQKRNLPSVPFMMDHSRLRRANSESHFSLPTVPSSIIIPNNNLDDESDLLEIDLNDPTGSMKPTTRSKTVSEIVNSNDAIYYLNAFNSSNQSPSVDELSSIITRKQTKQLRDQTTNTPPISSLNLTIKTKKKLKKKSSSPTASTNDEHSISTYTNGQIIAPTLSSTQTNPPELAVHVSSSSNNSSRPKLQKSTSTEMSYPFPVSKLILSRDSLNPSRRDGTDLGLRITGGHSIPNCMEVTACIEHIDLNHRNYLILQNAVQEGDEVLEVGGVSLRGKSALFVRNLMNSIEDEFEIIVRSQHVIPPKSPPIQIHKPQKSRTTKQPQQNLTPSYLMVDVNIHRRHSMDTSELSPTHSTNSTVVKSQSTIMPLPIEDSSNVSEQLLSPTIHRRKSVSSKERLFSVESLHRTSSTKSNQHLIKVATQSNDTSTPPDTPLTKHHESKPTTTLSLTTPENKTIFDDLSRRRIYEHRNSLLPNDPGLNGIGSTHSIERRSSNESDESENLSQYFRSTSSRKSSLMTTNTNVNQSHERSQSVTPNDNDLAIDASRRLQKFLKSNDEKRLSQDSTERNVINLPINEERKSSSTLGSFKFIKKKTKSVDYSSQSTDARNNEYVGDIQLQIGHDSEREQLVIRIIQAKNLPAKDANGYSDPFVKVYLLPGRDQENKRRTKHISKNLNPHWDHTVIYGNMHREEVQYKMLEFTVWDYDRFKANDFIGQVTIDLKDANVIDDKAHWYRLQASRSRDETTNRSSSPRLFKNTSIDSTTNSTVTLNKTSLNMQSPVNQRK